MKVIRKIILTTGVVAVLSVGLLTASKSCAQDGSKLPKAIHIQAQAMGTSTRVVLES